MVLDPPPTRANAVGYALQAIRFVLVAGGGLSTIGMLHALSTIPPAPPESEGFATGMAYLFGGVVLILSMGATGLGVALPSILGKRDVIGFGRYQRWVLRAAGACFLGGLLLGVAVAAVWEFQFGLLGWFLAIVLGVGLVVLALVWRLAAIVWTHLGRVPAA